MMVKKLIYSFVLIIILSGCSLNSQLKTAKKLQDNNNFIGAIEQYDIFINKTSDLELKTLAEIERSECYHLLGKQAMEKESWFMASRLFYLSNSEEADEVLDYCYNQLALKAINNGDSLTAAKYYIKLNDYLDKSEYLEDALVYLIDYNHNLKNDSLAFNYYIILESKFEDSSNIVPMAELVNDYILNKADQLYSKLNTSDIGNSLSKLKYYLDFRLPARDSISLMIADIYKQMGDSEYEKQQYEKAFNLYRQSIEFYGDNEDYYVKKFNLFVNTIENQSITLMNKGNYNEAIDILNLGLEIDPKNARLIARKQNLEEIKHKAELAQEAITKADNYYKDKNYPLALEYYQQSYNFLKTDSVAEKIFLLKNMIRAESDPKVFALEIIKKYKNGSIIKKINEKLGVEIDKYGHENVEKSDWKVLFYTGKYKYELRYDILTPDQNYYYVWVVDLKNQYVIPLNKLSESLVNE